MVRNVKSIEIKDVENIKAEYFNDNYIEEMPYTVHRINNYGRRFYMIQFDEENYIIVNSVTTIIKACHKPEKFYFEWLKEKGRYTDWFMKYAALYGTFLHILFSEILKGNTINIEYSALNENLESVVAIQGEKNNSNYSMYELKNFMREKKKNIAKEVFAFLAWIKDYNVDVVAIEYIVCTDKYAGAIDIVCYIQDGERKKLVIIDIKSGSNTMIEHDLQLEMLRLAWNENKPKLQIEDVYNLYMKDYKLPLKKNTKPYKFKKKSKSKYNYLVPLYIEQFYGDKDNYELKKMHQIKEMQISKDTNYEDMIEEINVVDKILNIEKKEKNEEAF